MKIKVSDYIANLLVEHNITNVFTVTGGGSMHLNDAFGHHSKLRCIYNHHEQASAIAAEAYARIENRIAAVCVTSGPGGTNAITGVLGGWLDSIPMLIISGQVRYDLTVKSTGLDLRSIGPQEFEITKAISCMTKYCEMIVDSSKIKYCVEKALYVAQNGRPGPCWLDIPLNIQGSYIETDEQTSFDPAEYASTLPLRVADATMNEIILKIKNAKRPVLYAGNGIRLSGGFPVFQRVIEKMNIPVVTGWNSIDLIDDQHPLYTGRGGIMGDRAGNFAIQNSDLLIAIGNRLSVYQVGYNCKTWAREAFVIAIDIDQAELKKPTVHIDMPLWANAKEFLDQLDSKISDGKFFKGYDWINVCNAWRERYPVVLPKYYETNDNTNIYVFIKELSNRLHENQITVVGNGSASVVGSACYTIKRNQRFIMNCAVSSMGYDLPASIGACVAANNSSIVLITGDGSIQMNIQELQTIIQNKLPIKIFIINNDGYHQIRQTQRNMFGGSFVGIGLDSGDLSFPDMSQLSVAYGYHYFSIKSNQELEKIDAILQDNRPLVCEVFVSKNQNFEPKSATRKLPDGRLESPPLEDLYPFLDRKELSENMFIKLINSSHS